ncbi:MAG: hypothetical protein RQ751_09710, partial [Longimicrobiales bacterium]|nr:hypothetical protein [Longimicrobiales bacterium]
MRSLLLWLLEDLYRLLDPGRAQLEGLRRGILRARGRHAHHQAGARDAAARIPSLQRRVRALEMAPDTPLDALVVARRELMTAEGDVAHHRTRAGQAEALLTLMREDRAALVA